MNGFQITFLIVSIVCTAACLTAIAAIIRAPEFAFKPLWVLGSMFGFVGVSLDWNRPDDLFAQIGIAIPVVRVVWFSSGAVVAQAMFPIVAAIALWRIWVAEDLRRDLKRQQDSGAPTSISGDAHNSRDALR